MSKNLEKAMKHIAMAQKELVSTVASQGKKLETHDKILQNQGESIAKLEKQVLEFRNAAIQAEVKSGERTDVVAKRYNLSPSRVSQIAPRNTH